MNTGATIGNLSWFASSLPELYRFKRRSRHVEATQEKRLKYYLQRNADTAFGRQHDFATIGSFADYAERVPGRNYDDFEPWISRIAAGEPNVLSADPVRLFEPTSGSSGPSKLIPYTDALQQEIRQAVAVWSAQNFCAQPSLLFGRAYWSLTPQMNESKYSDSVIPIGFDEDSAYLGGVAEQLINRTMVSLPALRQIEDMELFWHLTLLRLLQCKDMRLISVWHPSYLVLLIERLRKSWPSLLEDLTNGIRVADPPLRISGAAARARELRSLGCDDLQRIWPNLKLISCWADGHAATSIPQLKSYFPNVQIQAKGLIATEGIVTIPFGNQRPLAYRSHVFEFFDDNDKVYAPWQIENGQTYSVAITTGGGLYRYRLGDLVKVNGFVDAVPCLDFIGREDQVSDFFGEKLSEVFVGGVVRDLFAEFDRVPRFAILALDESQKKPAYVLYAEVDGELPDDLSPRLECKLCANPHYELCTRLGQLDTVRIQRIKGNGFDVFSGRMSELGMRVGDIKPTPLSRLSGWDRYFYAAVVD